MKYTISEVIERIRQDRGLRSRAAVARAAGLKSSTVQGWCDGHMPPADKLQAVLRLSNAVKLDDIDFSIAQD